MLSCKLELKFGNLCFVDLQLSSSSIISIVCIKCARFIKENRYIYFYMRSKFNESRIDSFRMYILLRNSCLIFLLPIEPLWISSDRVHAAILWDFLFFLSEKEVSFNFATCRRRRGEGRENVCLLICRNYGRVQCKKMVRNQFQSVGCFH